MKEISLYWPHAPMHRLLERGTYMVTGGTYLKQSFLNTPEKLSLICNMLFEFAEKYGWRLQAWAVMNNHYHFVASSPESPDSLKILIAQLHEYSAKKLNRMDGATGRKVWHNYWDSHITHQTSFFSRLRYVHQNPVHHGVTENASSYEWCSQRWLEQNSPRSFVNTLARFKTDSINVQDAF
jgi:putative transposase